MATRPKAVIESRNGEKLSPITIAKNVLTDDGQNLHDILSDRKEDMMTPTIENSSSMFKVGQGDNVDYSENVVDGAYESCVLKGRSLVNLINFSNSTGSANANKNGDTLTITAINNDAWSAHSFELNGMSHDKTYIACWDNLTFTHSHEDGKRSVVGIYAPDDEGKQVVIAEINRNQSFNYLIFTLPSNVPPSKKVYFRIHATTWEGELGATTTIKGAKVLEYVEDMENWNIPYFEGLCDVKSPILSNVGKNLFNPQKIIHPTNDTNLSIEGNCIYIADGSLNGWGEIQIAASLPIGTYYVDILENGNFIEGRNRLWVRGVGATMLANVSNRQVFTITEPAVRIDLVIQNANNLTFNNTQYSIHIEKANTAPHILLPHEPYKSNITTFNQKDGKTIVLRSLPNGVCDTLNVETGELTQRIGEVVLDGSEDENWELNNTESTSTKRFAIGNFLTGSNVTNDWNGANKYVCDKLNKYLWSDTVEFGITVINNSVFLYNNNTDYSIGALKTWLSQNPITVQYELATPIVSTIDIQGFPHAYKDGHMQLSSGHSGQSLTPKVEYSVATNRNGQIRSNQKMVERHQKQLDRLQAMILTNLVNTQYEQTLTNLKYDLKNVREEVK